MGCNMKMIIKKTIGGKSYEFQFEGQNLFECVMESQKLSFNDVYKCGKCGSEHLYFSAYNTKEGYKYVKVACAKCRASVTFGSKREDPDVSFLRKTSEGKIDWQEYKGKEERVEKKENLGWEE